MLSSATRTREGGLTLSDASIVRRWTAKLRFYQSSEALWKRRHTSRQERLTDAERSKSYRYRKWRDYASTLPDRHELRIKWWRLYQEAKADVERYTELRDEASDKLKLRREQIADAKKVIARHTPETLAERAYKIAASQVGVMETGGNNRGVPYERYQKPNGAPGPEPWCGDFCAWVYRKAGSKFVTRAWAAVRLIPGVFGIKRATKPVRGDLVRFTFDHVGIFVADLGSSIETIEGNTGASGAVSDSATGGDGVYRKVRPKSQVRDYQHVTG